MVAFENHRLAAADAFGHVRGDRADVGDHGQALGTVAGAELKRLGRVVGDGEGPQLDVAHGDHVAIAGEPQVGRLRQRADGAPGAAAHPDRQPLLQGHRDRAADVVAVLVGHEEGVDIGQSEPGAGEPALQLAKRKPGVDQEPGGRDAARRLDEGRVAVAAAAQAAEADQARVTSGRRAAARRCAWCSRRFAGCPGNRAPPPCCWCPRRSP